MSREITIEVLPNGKIKVEAHGYKGKGCDIALDEIERLLGFSKKNIEKKLKSEYHLKEKDRVKA